MKQFLDFKKLLDFYKNKQLLVFGYGSLMWNPDFEYLSSEIFNLQSFYRDFCVFSTHYRGTEEKPGLVLGLRKEDNRNCIGKLFVVAEEKKEEVLSRLWEREMLGDIYIPTVLSFHKKTLAKNLAGEIFTFVANSQSVKFCQLPNEKKSEIFNLLREKKVLVWTISKKLNKNCKNLKYPTLYLKVCFCRKLLGA